MGRDRFEKSWREWSRGFSERPPLKGRRTIFHQEPEIVHFGLGQEDLVDEILVEWPSGARQAVSDVASNTLLTIEQEGGEPAAAAPTPMPTELAAAPPPKL